MERGVIITLDNGALGRTQGTEDGIFGMLLTAPEAAFYSGNGPVPPNPWGNFKGGAIYKADDFIRFGITRDRAAETGTDLFEQLDDFYSFPQNNGRKLWVAAVSDNMDLVDAFADQVPKLLDLAQGEISVLFLGGKQNIDNPNAVNSLDSNVIPIAQAAQLCAELYASKIMPVRVIIDGINYTGNEGNLLNLTTLSLNRVAINLCNKNPTAHNSSQGLLAGRMAYIPINESVGWVDKGALPITEGYFNDNILIERNINTVNPILDKGYICFQKYPHKYGYFYCNIRTATALTDDYSRLTEGRTIDKAFKLAYQTFVKYVNGKIYVNSNGTLNIMQVKAIEADIENTLNLQMVAKGECSFVKCIIDPKQKVLSTNELQIGVKIGPTATLELLKVKLGFAQSV